MTRIKEKKEKPQPIIVIVPVVKGSYATFYGEVEEAVDMIRRELRDIMKNGGSKTFTFTKDFITTKQRESLDEFKGFEY